MMTEENQRSPSPFEGTTTGLAHLTRSERDRAIWNAALYWASQNVYMEVVDEMTGKITEEKLKSMDLMDEIYQVSALSILCGIEIEEER